MINKEAIEKFEKAIGTMPHIEHKADKNDCYCLVSEALALLKEQPPASEFTKRMRETYPTECIEDKQCGQDFREACDRLDDSEASRKALLAALKKYGDHEPGCIKGDACNCGFEAAIEKAEK